VAKPIMPQPSARRGPSSAMCNPCVACGVRDLSICGALEGHELDRLASLVTQRTIAPGETVFFESDSATNLFVIADGSIKIYKLLADGRRQVTGFLYPSDFLGLAFQERYAYSAEAIVETRLCRFERGALEALLEQYPRLEKRLLGVASNELASAQDQMLLLGRKTAEEKVASFLYTLSRRAYRKRLPAETLSLPMTRNDIADYLGLTTETVSRCFTRLKRDGVIGFEQAHEIRICDWDAFIDLVGFDDAWEPHTAA